MNHRSLLSVGLVAALAQSAMGQIVVPGADGSDGAFNPGTGTTTVNLANSPTAAWDAPNPDPGTPLTGVYDPDKWAVVFRFSSVNIPSNATVTFTNHPSRAPVIWLVSGSVTITGVVNLNSMAISGSAITEGGPGGFRGGRGHLGNSNPGSSGFGPGGGHMQFAVNAGGSGSYGTVGIGNFAGDTYGSQQIIPLIGGSGGSGYIFSSNAGAGGGGAILIAASQNITLNGTTSSGIFANSNGASSASAGSGGAIRLVAHNVSGTGVLRAINTQHDQGKGRIRVERNSGLLNDPGNPAISYGLPGAMAAIWPDSTAPTVRIAMVHNQAVPADPRASLDFPGPDVSLTNPNPVIVQLHCTNVPTPLEPPAATVTLRVTPTSGADTTLSATYASGDINASIWTVQLSLADGFTALQARAVLP